MSVSIHIVNSFCWWHILWGFFFFIENHVTEGEDVYVRQSIFPVLWSTTTDPTINYRTLETPPHTHALSCLSGQFNLFFPLLWASCSFSFFLSSSFSLQLCVSPFPLLPFSFSFSFHLLSLPPLTYILPSRIIITFGPSLPHPFIELLPKIILNFFFLKYINAITNTIVHNSIIFYHWCLIDITWLWFKKKKKDKAIKKKKAS